jgi:RNA-directed DNA polymerase
MSKQGERKQYNINRSPLYKIGNKRALATLINTDLKNLYRLLKKDNYWISDKTSKSGKVRIVHAPKPEIKKILAQIQKLLSRITTPNFLFSSKKGRCNKDNAEFHKDSAKYLMNVDIHSFYTSCRQEYVFKCFHYKFQMSADVAWLLANIVSYEEYLPTGSPCSQLVAYLSYEDTFLRIRDLAEKKGFTFSLYVDDMTFSSQSPIHPSFDKTVNQELSKVNLEIKTSKTSKFKSRDHKLVTGCIISPQGELRVKNKTRRDIIDSWEALHNNEEKCQKRVQSLIGKIVSARQIESNFFESKLQYLTALNNKL